LALDLDNAFGIQEDVKFMKVVLGGSFGQDEFMPLGGRPSHPLVSYIAA
jgi:hypothetical protein